MVRDFIRGFAACYALAGIASACNVAEIPATTKAGVIYAAVMWAPINLLPNSMARELVPAWAFDFDQGAAS